MAPKKKGRPTKLTEEILQKLEVLIQNGNYIETAAAVVGIHKSSLYLWLKKGAREQRGIYKKFSDAVLKAQGMAEARDVSLITKAASEDWKAAAWRLERKFPGRWGRRINVAQIGQIDPKELSDEELLELLEGDDTEGD